MITPPTTAKVTLTNPLELIQLIMALRILQPGQYIQFIGSHSAGLIKGRVLTTHPGLCAVSILVESQ